MSQNNNTFNPFDPTGVFKDLRDANMDQWAKMMVEVVNSDAYAEASGSMLDTWLSNSAPFRKLFESNMNQTLASLQLPSREEITRLADRMTSIEMRLDDLDATLHEILQSVRQPSAE